ncbi:MAG: septal ring lytic transglycosylase RlpA family protein [Candidatus Competibacter sp.]|nr:septal ring lytic transglycosylase RlpA family protein [Candidatus Competibacter sp.]MDG4584691.1 septal ring lytic transglycosylase RlpA family protein [Candidatus Competibacter sp.]
MAKSWSQALLLTSLAGALAGCGTIPDRPANIRSAGTSLNIAPSGDEPIPRAEPPSRGGNADTYVVFGRRYRVRETSEGYREEGTASWYGEDFHGRKTSSGPLYDMYELTAAHKSLPLPTYVRVTNLENGRSTVVKVTDRGPFVSGRIIDLSYAAALRLDMLERGTALVEVAALEPYQHLPELAARRAAERELLAAVAARNAQRSAERVALAARTESRTKPAATVRLASAAPTAKSKSAPVERRAGSAGKNGALYLVGTVSERGSPPQQLQNRLASQLRRSVRVESTTGSRYQIRVPLRDSSEARQVAVRLAGLGISHSRVVAD